MKGIGSAVKSFPGLYPDSGPPAWPRPLHSSWGGPQILKHNIFCLISRILSHFIKTLRISTPEIYTWGSGTTGTDPYAACQGTRWTWWSECPPTTTGPSGEKTTVLYYFFNEPASILILNQGRFGFNWWGAANFWARKNMKKLVQALGLWIVVVM